MAFGITVHRRADDAIYRTHPEVSSDEFDRWIKECRARWVYENPLGAGGTVFELWHVPARELGLPLLGSVYHDGLHVEGEHLAALSRELDALEGFWAATDFSMPRPHQASIIHPDGRHEEWSVPLAEHLRERLGYLREAIRIAEECDGVVDIG